jgi:hypothetical protein
MNQDQVLMLCRLESYVVVNLGFILNNKGSVILQPFTCLPFRCGVQPHDSRVRESPDLTFLHHLPSGTSSTFHHVLQLTFSVYLIGWKSYFREMWPSACEFPGSRLKGAMTKAAKAKKMCRGILGITGFDGASIVFSVLGAHLLIVIYGSNV